MSWKKRNRWMPYNRRDEIARFMEKVDVDEEAGHWYWKATIESSGYGRFWLNAAHKAIPAHVASFVLFKNKGELLPTGIVVRHKCDIPACVAPKHLLRGTPKQNSADMVSRGRAARGEQNNCATISEEMVRQLKSEYVNRWGELSRLAKKYNLPLSTVANIIDERTWKHVPWGSRKRFKKALPLPAMNRGERHYKAKLTADDVREILEGVSVGIRPVEFAEKHNISRNAISAIIHGRVWRDVFESFMRGRPAIARTATVTGGRWVGSTVARGKKMTRQQKTEIAHRGTSARWGKIHLGADANNKGVTVNSAPRGQRLTADGVKKIRADHKLGITTTALAERYSVSMETVQAIVYGRSWTSL